MLATRTITERAGRGRRQLPGAGALWAVLVALGAGGLACGQAEQPGDAPTAPVSAASPSAEVRPRGLWVLAEGTQRVLEHPDRVPVLLDDAVLLGATDLFVQVYRGGRAWFDSDRTDAAPFRAAHAASGRDPLAALLEAAHGRGLRVHAWVNVLSLARNREAPIIKALGREIVLVDRHGRSLLDYPELEVPEPDRRYYRMGTPGIYLDPAHPGLATHLAALFAELLRRYPGLDGLHYDYIRYPDVLPFTPGSRFGVGLDFGHGEPTRQRFRAETGFEAPSGDGTRNANRWDAWRREKLTQLVATLGAEARTARPGVVVSAAVWTYADRAYLTIGQDWRRWLEEGLLDFAVPMAYTRDDRLLRYQVEGFAHLPQADRIWIGLGTWLFERHPGRALTQIAIARDAGTAGDSLFSWDSIAASPALRSALILEPDDGP